jgi:hypothetical protein
MAKVKQFTSGGEVRRELSLLYDKVKRDEIPLKKAETMKGILYAVLTSVSIELKEKEIQTQEELIQEIRKVKGEVQ